VRRRKLRDQVTTASAVGVTAYELAEVYPRLYHMAELGSWPSILRHGLLSTSHLLSLFELNGSARDRIESRHRPESITIHHPRYGNAVVRDQIPMRDADLQRCLRDGMVPRKWYRLLNAKVFFWLTEERLERLLGARAYRDRRHTVLVLDTKALLDDYSDTVFLSPMKSGCTTPFAHPRGPGTFLPMSAYPFKARRKKARVKAVVELAVEGGVHKVERYAIEVRERRFGEVGRVIWSRAG